MIGKSTANNKHSLLCDTWLHVGVCVCVYVCMCLHVCERVCLFHNPQKSNNNSNSSTHRDTHMHKTLLFGTHKKKQSVKFHFIFTPLPLSLPPTRDTIVPSPRTHGIRQILSAICLSTYFASDSHYSSLWYPGKDKLGKSVWSYRFSTLLFYGSDLVKIKTICFQNI